MLNLSGQAVGLFEISARLELEHDGELATVGYLNKLPSYFTENKQAERGCEKEYCAEKDFAGVMETPLEEIKIVLTESLVIVLKGNGKLFERVFACKVFDFGES